ncbi:hypothetical protein JXI42_00430 [bacterium]|nr:hypothetical protein [bacterium]
MEQNQIGTTGSIFHADTNEVDQSRFEVEFIESECSTSIDVKDFFYDWVKSEMVNKGLIIVPNSKRIGLLPIEVRAERIGEFKLKYIPVAR